MPRRGDTLSHVDVRRRPERRGPCLCLEIECERPLAGPARWRLTDFQQVHLHRGDRRAAHPANDQVLDIEIPDAWMSWEHLAFRVEGGTWDVRDLGSKNGLTVDGQRRHESKLKDGSLLLAGHTLIRFRSDVPIDGPAILDFDGALDSVDSQTTLSPAFELILERARAIAPTRAPVLLVGETGTGKEVLARVIHGMSGRRGALVAVNCGAIPPNLVEAELFGHKKGAFSGADADRPGLVRASDGGTLFLDEIGDLPPGPQVALLRVLQEAEVLPVGGVRPMPLDLRVLAATNQDLEQLVAEQKFRRDLFARLDGVTLALPPLRERSEDLPLLIALLLRKLAPERPEVTFTPDAADALLKYSWPLNVRELKQALTGGLALSGSGPIDLTHLPPAVTGRTTPERHPLTPEESKQRDELIEQLRQRGGNISAVARALGKHRNQVVRLLARFEIDARALDEDS